MGGGRTRPRSAGDRVAGEVALTWLPRHRTYGSVYGGSRAARKPPVAPVGAFWAGPPKPSRTPQGLTVECVSTPTAGQQALQQIARATLALSVPGAVFRELLGNRVKQFFTGDPAIKAPRGLTPPSQTPCLAHHKEGRALCPPRLTNLTQTATGLLKRLRTLIRARPGRATGGLGCQRACEEIRNELHLLVRHARRLTLRIDLGAQVRPAAISGRYVQRHL